MTKTKSDQPFSLKKNFGSAGQLYGFIFLVLAAASYYAFGDKGLAVVAVLYMLGLVVIFWIYVR